MMIREKLIVLLLGLCSLAVGMLFVLAVVAQQQTSYLQTYGWGDRVDVFGPETRPTAPEVAVTLTREGGLVLVWDSADEEAKIMLARSTDRIAWSIVRLGWELTDWDSQPAVMADSDGAVWLAWRGGISPERQRREGRYVSGIFWTVSRDGGVSWDRPRGLCVFEANLSESGGAVRETIYSRPQICQSGDRVRIYYVTDQAPDSGWVWYRETGDKGASWGDPVQIPGCEPYDRLALTRTGKLLTLQRGEDRSVRVTVRDDEGRVESESFVGHGWPSYVGQGVSGRIWAVWDRASDQKAKREYRLGNGTVLASSYVRDDVWVSTSVDEGFTWSEPARLGWGVESERAGIVLEDERGGCVAVVARYPGSEIVPWSLAWRWTISIKHAERVEIAKVKVVAG